MEEKTGTITDIVFRNDENGYTVAVMETETEYFTVVGNLPQCVKGSRANIYCSHSPLCRVLIHPLFHGYDVLKI